MTKLNELTDVLIRAEQRSPSTDELSRAIALAQGLSRDQQHAVALVLDGIELTDEARRSVAKDLPLPAVERAQLAARLGSCVDDHFHLTPEQFRFFRHVLPKIAPKCDGALVARGALSMKQLVYALADAERSPDNAESLSRKLYRDNGAARKALDTRLQQMPWLADELVGFKPAPRENGSLRRFWRALCAGEPTSIVAVAATMLAVTSLALSASGRGTDSGATAPLLAEPVQEVEPQALAELREALPLALASGRLSNQTTLINAINHRTLGAEFEEIATAAGLSVIPGTLVQERVPVACPPAADWIPTFLERLGDASSESRPAVLVLARNVGSRVLLSFHEVASPFRTLLCVQADSSHVEPTHTVEDYIQRAELVARQRQADNPYSQLYLAMARSKVTMGEEWCAWAYAKGALLRDGGQVTEGEALMQQATGGDGSMFVLRSATRSKGAVAALRADAGGTP